MLNIPMMFCIIILISRFQWILSEGLQVRLEAFYEAYENFFPRKYNLAEHEALEIECISRNELPVFNYPDLLYIPPWSKRSRSVTVITHHTETYNTRDGTQVTDHIVVLRKNRTLFGDTGEYECHNRLGKKSGTINIYVKSNTSFFVEENVIPKPIFSVSRDEYWKFKSYFHSLCETTSPEHSVFLRQNLKRIFQSPMKFGIHDRRTYIEPGEYACGPFKKGQFLATKEFIIVSEPCKKYPPKMTGKRIIHVIRNQTLRINCTMEDDIFLPAGFSWSSSGQNLDRITTRYEIPHPTIMNCRTVVNELKILNVNDHDIGELNCKMTSIDSMLRSTPEFVSVKLEVHDVNFTKCKLSTTVNHYKSIVGNSIQFNVSIDSYPYQPQITWFDSSKKTIKEERIEDQKDKFIIETSDEQSKLTIMNLSSLDDGSYRVRAKTPDHQDSIIFMLDIWEHHLMRNIINVQNFYMQDDFANISCITAPDLNLEITWTFTVDRSSLPHSYDGSIAEMEFTSSNSTVGWRIQSSGTITCKVCISDSSEPDKCYTAKRQIFMTDVPGGFGIIPSKEIVMIGDSLELICAASIYNYTDQIHWLNVDGSPLVISDRKNINQTRAPLSNRAVLTIDPIEKYDDNTSYICSSARMHDNRTVENITYTLNVHVMELQNVTTNINGKKFRTLNVLSTQTENGIFTLRNKSQESNIEQVEQECSEFHSCRVTNGSNVSVTHNQSVKMKPRKAVSDEETGSFGVMEISILMVMILCFFIALYLWIDKVLMEKKLKKMGVLKFEEGVPGSLDPNSTMDQQAAYLPYDIKYEFPQRKLKFTETLGSGVFGVVMKAEARGICKGDSITTVAVKTARDNSLKDLANELKIMIYLGKHANLITLLGACTRNISKGKLLVITEYCRFGSLEECLERFKASFINQIIPATGRIDFSIGPDHSIEQVVNQNSAFQVANPEAPFDNQSSVYVTCVINQDDKNPLVISTWVLLWWAWQIARGMQYLGEKKVLHRDLATRNILLAEGNIAKICDFGLSKSLWEKDYYRKATNIVLPSKWMAIESLGSGIFSIKSDVWSFGVLLWECFTLGQSPYATLESNLYEFLENDGRLEIPDYANEEIYGIMNKCWNASPQSRPTFKSLIEQIGSLLEEDERILISRLRASNQGKEKIFPASSYSRRIIEFFHR